MNLRLENCDKVIGRYWRVAMYKCLGVFLKESLDIVVHHNGGYWWVVEIESKECLGKGAPRATDWFSSCNMAEVSRWFPPQCSWESDVLQIISGHQWLCDQYAMVTEELEELQVKYEKLEERFDNRCDEAFELGKGKGLQGKGSDAGKGKDKDKDSQGKGWDKNRFPGQNNGVRMGWMNKMVALLGSIIENDTDRTEHLVSLLFRCV